MDKDLIVQAYKKACIACMHTSRKITPNNEDEFVDEFEMRVHYRTDLGLILKTYYGVTDYELQQMLNDAVGAPHYHI